jgi:hypothetical protein
MRSTQNTRAAAGSAALLAPFIAWLATREADEPLRRRYREIVGHYLRWTSTDQGDPGTRRHRYEEQLRRDGRIDVDLARAALDRFDEHRAVAARTPSLH